MEVYEVSVDQYVAFLNFLGPNGHKTGCQGQPCALTNIEDATAVTSPLTVPFIRCAIRNFRAIIHPHWSRGGALRNTAAPSTAVPTKRMERAARGSQLHLSLGIRIRHGEGYVIRAQATGTVPVNSYPNGTSPYGIYNMAGNVSEWVSDWYQSDYYTQQLNAHRT